MENCNYLMVGDSAVAIEFSREIRPDVNNRICALRDRLRSANIRGITETVPTYGSLLVHYDPTVISYRELRDQLDQVRGNMGNIVLPAPVVKEIPVCYGGSFGPDLSYVAQFHNMSEEQVIQAHSAPDYLVYMLGFIAGFPYLGGMDPQLATPRLDTPRLEIEGGSVGIAGQQTGVYPVAAPGGWQLIGRTPLKLYDPDRSKVSLLDAGDYVHFRPISQDEYRDIEQQVAMGRYAGRSWQKAETPDPPIHT